MATVTNHEDRRRVQAKRSTSGDDNQKVNRQSRSSVSQGDQDTRSESDSDPATAQNSEPGPQVATDPKPAHESRSHGKRRRSKDSAVSTEATVPQRGRDRLSSVKRRRSPSAPRKMPKHINKLKSGTEVDAANDENEQTYGQRNLLAEPVHIGSNHHDSDFGEMSLQKRAVVADRLAFIDKDLYTPTAGMTNGLRKDDPRVLKEVLDEVAHVESSEESSGDERPATMFGYYL
jgi:hypothetical protein